MRPAASAPQKSAPKEESATAEEPDEEKEEKLDAAIEQELRYAELLTRHGLPDYAERVLRTLNPDVAGPRYKVLQLQGLIARGKFDDVNRVIAQEPDPESATTWAMRLALADGYFAWGKYKEARALYEGFFRKYKDGPPKELNTFFRDSAYKYAQMLLLMGDPKASIEAYRTALKAKLKRHVRRQILAEMAELMLKEAEKVTPEARKKIAAEVEKLLEDVLYAEQMDLWFGKAMTMLAHIRLMENDMEGAMLQVETFWDSIVQIDGALRYEEQKQGGDLTKYSPLAQCRYLLGDMMLKEARKLIPPKSVEEKQRAFDLLARKDEAGKGRDGAFRHFINVYVNYPASPWAPEALEKAKEAQRLLQELGATVSYTIPPEKLEEMEKAQFREARMLFNQNQYKEAAEAFFRALRMFPETEMAVSALGDLALCFVEMNLLENVPDDERVWNDRYVDLLVGYLAERFNKNRELSVKAGDVVLRIADRYDELKRADRKLAAYNVFFEHFTRHPRTPEKLFVFGQQQLDVGHVEGALDYFFKIQTNYVGSRVFHPTLSRIALCYNKREDYPKEIQTLMTLIASLKKEKVPDPLLLTSMYRLAYALHAFGAKQARKAETSEGKASGEKFLNTAIKKFDELIGILSDVTHPLYPQKAEDRENNQTMLQGALYYTGVCYTMLTQPADKVAEFKNRAAKTYQRLAYEFPKSRFAPSALAQLGTLYTIMKDASRAKEALEKLEKQYPESEEAKNSKFILAMNLLQLGMREEAIRAFKDMFEGGGQFNAMQILTAGLKLGEAKEHEIALDAFRKVMANTQKGTPTHELALLGRGKSAAELRLADEAIQALEAVKKEYPQSKSIVEASLYLSRAYGEKASQEPDRDKRVALFNRSIRNINFARRYMKTPSEQAFAQLAIGKTFLSMITAEEKHGNPETVQEAVDKAIVPLWSLATTGNLEDTKARMYIEEAFTLLIPLYLKSKRWKDAWERCSEYLETFGATATFSETMRKWRGEAQTKMILEGTAPEDLVRSPTQKPLEEAGSEVLSVSVETNPPPLAAEPKEKEKEP